MTTPTTDAASDVSFVDLLELGDAPARVACPTCGGYQCTPDSHRWPTAPVPAAITTVTPVPTACTCVPPIITEFRSESDRTRVCRACRLPRPQATPPGFGSVRRPQATNVVPGAAHAIVAGIEAHAAAHVALRPGNIVAGAAAEGHGKLLGFGGRGELTRAKLLQLVTESGVGAENAPAPKSAHAHAGRVVGALNHSGYVVRAERTTRQDRERTAAPATWSARWTVQTTSRGATVGQAAGTIVAVALLSVTGTFVVESSEVAIKARLEDEFAALQAGEVYAAADISAWLKSMLVTKFRAAKLGGNWYVKRGFADAAEKLIATFAKHWGENFLLPALPVATSEQLKFGIAASFNREVDEALTEYRAAKEAAKTESKEMGTRASLSHLTALRELTERCVGYSALLGDELIGALRRQIVAAAEEIEQTVDGMSQRFDMIFDELRREEERKG